MLIALLFLILAVVPARGVAQDTKAAQQQEKASQKDAPVPKAYLPPAGMCRVWVDNVPAGRQPAPTDCATAIRNRPPNARVIFPAEKAGRSSEPKALVPTAEGGYDQEKAASVNPEQRRSQTAHKP